MYCCFIPLTAAGCSTVFFFFIYLTPATVLATVLHTAPLTVLTLSSLVFCPSVSHILCTPHQIYSYIHPPALASALSYAKIFWVFFLTSLLSNFFNFSNVNSMKGLTLKFFQWIKALLQCVVLHFISWNTFCSAEWNPHWADKGGRHPMPYWLSCRRC